MTDLLTAAQMRHLEQAAMERGEVTGLELMERAGQGVVDAILTSHPDPATSPGCATVFCGPGNNGGDGFVIARLLHERGWDVEVFLYGRAPADIDRLPPDAAENARRWAKLGEILPFSASGLVAATERWKRLGQGSVVLVDALFGIGQRAPLDDVLDPLQRMTDAIFGEAAGPAPFFVSVDVPTGYDADTGASLARYPVPADLIVTFHAKKPIHVMPHLLDGEVVVVDIGLGRPSDLMG